jgi:transposase-like protein
MKISNAGSARNKRWQELVRQHGQSKLSVSAFCREQGVSDQSFYYWRKRLLSDRGPVRLALVERGAPVTHDNASVELILACGDRLRIAPGIDAATLRTVLSVLRERA